MIMPLAKLTSNVTANNDLYSKLSSYQKINQDDLKMSKLTLSNSDTDGIFIDLADIFIFNTLVINDINAGKVKKDIEKISYKATSAYHLHSLVVYLSHRFPNMIMNSPEEIFGSLQHALKDIIKRRKHDQTSDEDSHYFYVEECNDDRYLNIVCDTDYFLKIDTLEERILFMYKGKLALLTFYFLQYQQRKEILELLTEALQILNVKNSTLLNIDLNLNLDNVGIT